MFLERIEMEGGGDVETTVPSWKKGIHLYCSILPVLSCNFCCLQHFEYNLSIRTWNILSLKCRNIMLHHKFWQWAADPALKTVTWELVCCHHNLANIHLDSCFWELFEILQQFNKWIANIFNKQKSVMLGYLWFVKFKMRTIRHLMMFPKILQTSVGYLILYFLIYSQYIHSKNVKNLHFINNRIIQ